MKLKLILLLINLGLATSIFHNLFCFCMMLQATESLECK